MIYLQLLLIIDGKTYSVLFIYLLVLLTEGFAGAYSFRKLQSMIVLVGSMVAGRQE